MASTVFLATTDGHHFTVGKEVAHCSTLIKNILKEPISAGLGEAAASPIRLDVTSAVLTKVISYCQYYKRLIESDQQFIDVDQDMLFKIILAAHYLDIQPLLDVGYKIVANIINAQDQTLERIDKMFRIVGDSPEKDERENTGTALPVESWLRIFELRPSTTTSDTFNTPFRFASSVIDEWRSQSFPWKFGCVQLKSLQSLQSLDSLKLENGFPWIKDLTLHMTNNPFDQAVTADSACKLAAHCTHLTALRIKVAEEQDLLNVLKAAPPLEELEVSGPLLTDGFIRTLHSQHPKLQVLILKTCEMQFRQASQPRLSDLRKLHTLHLAGIFTPSESESQPSILDFEMPSVKTLTLNTPHANLPTIFQKYPSVSTLILADFSDGDFSRMGSISLEKVKVPVCAKNCRIPADWEETSTLMRTFTDKTQFPNVEHICWLLPREPRADLETLQGEWHAKLEELHAKLEELHAKLEEPHAKLKERHISFTTEDRATAL
jgi:S-phase kinase-associated protein 1